MAVPFRRPLVSHLVVVLAVVFPRFRIVVGSAADLFVPRHQTAFADLFAPHHRTAAAVVVRRNSVRFAAAVGRLFALRPRFFHRPDFVAVGCVL